MLARAVQDSKMLFASLNESWKIYQEAKETADEEKTKSIEMRLKQVRTQLKPILKDFVLNKNLQRTIDKITSRRSSNYPIVRRSGTWP
jgi:hypothetical protein